MKYDIIEIKELIKSKNTYPTWSTGSSYPLKCKALDKDNVLVFYITKFNKKFSRVFPKYLNITPKLACILGLIKGEGANALGKSNYRRFTFTNADCFLVKKVLKTLYETKLFLKENIKNKSIYLLHFKKEEQEVVNYWSKKLDLSSSKFICFDSERKTTDFGVCHLYISDVFLRRVIDLLIERLLY